MHTRQYTNACPNVQFYVVKLYNFYYSSLAPFDPKAVDVMEVYYVQMHAQDFEEESSHLIKGLMLCDDLGVLVGNMNTSTKIKQGMYSALTMVAKHMMR